MFHKSIDVITKMQAFERYFETHTNRNYPGRMSVAIKMMKGVDNLIICDDYHEEVLAIREDSEGIVIQRRDGYTERYILRLSDRRELYKIIKSIMQDRCPKDTIPWRRINKKDL